MSRSTISSGLFAIVVLALSTMLISNSRGETADDPDTPQLKAVFHLHDGSSVAGTLPVDFTLPIQTAFGSMKIPLALACDVVIGESDSSTRVTFHNTDKLTGVLNMEHLDVTTSFGKISLSAQDINHIKIEKPPMIFASPTVLFDGKSLDHWYQTPPWAAKGGALVCPTTKSINRLISKDTIDGPFELTLEIKLLRLRRQDAKGIFIENAQGNRIPLVRLDDQPNMFQVGRNTRATTDQPLDTERWYAIRVVLNDSGKLNAWLNESQHLSTTINFAPPFVVGLECERSGACFRNISIRKAQPYEVETEHIKNTNSTIP